MPQSPATALPKRWPLTLEADNRDDESGTDARLVNCYLETHAAGDTKEFWVYKRGGLATGPDFSRPTAVAGLGLYVWQGDVFAIFGNTLYRNNEYVGEVEPTGGMYHFSSTLGETKTLLLGNGLYAYCYFGGMLHEVVSVHFQKPFVKGWAYLNGTTYCMLPNAHIQGSASNEPSTWDPLNSIMAQIEPDAGVALAKQLVYAVAMKKWSTEFFYDAGNAQGSPLAPVQGAKMSYGCASAELVQNIDDVLFWVSLTKSATLQVVMVEGTKPLVVSTKAVERLLHNADTTNVASFAFKDAGHSFYVITFRNNNLTLAFDVKERLWSQWTDANGNYLPYVAAVTTSDRQHLWQHETAGQVHVYATNLVEDFDQPIVVDIYTPNLDADTLRRKTLNSMFFVADQTPGSTLSVQYNDTDYSETGWSSYRQVNLGNKRPMLTNNGSFIRRAYHFRHASPTKFRMKAVELQLDLGTL